MGMLSSEAPLATSEYLGYAPGSEEQYNNDRRNRVRVEGDVEGFENPGAATFGGIGADWYSKAAKAHMADNNNVQGANDANLRYSLGQMQGDRGPQSVENGVLSGRSAQTRQEQEQSLGQLAGAAAGNAPSEAAYQTGIGMNSLMGQRAGALGGARGLSALTGAQGGSSAMGAAAGTLAAQGGQGRSDEIGQAIGQYGTAAGNVRGQDLSRLGLNSKNSMFNANLNDEWKLGNATNAINAGNLGNQLSGTDQAWYKQSMEPTATQFAHDQQAQGWQAGSFTDADAIDRERRKAAQAEKEGYAKMGYGAVASYIGKASEGSGSTSDGTGMGGSKKP